jgi:hypothetical protein
LKKDIKTTESNKNFKIEHKQQNLKQRRFSMKSSIKGLVVILVIVMSFVAVQSVCAETVTGTIDEISTQPNKIVVNGTEISGVRYNYLCNQYNICLELGDTVSIEYYEYECSNGTVMLKACKITVNEATIALRDCQ